MHEQSQSETTFEDYVISIMSDALRDYMAQGGLDDDELRKAPQSRWNSALIYIYNHCFKRNRKILFCVPKSRNGMVIDYAMRKYDIDKIDVIADVYISMCYEYDKMVCINGFSKLTGIPYSGIAETNKITDYFDISDNTDSIGSKNHSNYLYNNIYNNPSNVSSNNSVRVSNMVSNIYKKISNEREQSLVGFLVSGKRNPMSCLPALNHYNQWNLPGVSKEVKTEALPSSELPKLRLDTSNSDQDTPQIEQNNTKETQKNT